MPTRTGPRDKGVTIRVQPIVPSTDPAERHAMHERHMRAALAEARRADAAGEVPVGAVVVVEGEIAGTGFNQPIATHDPTAHAEVVALRAAGRAAGNYRLSGAALYVTVEPCLMCVGAMVHARIGVLVYGAPEPKAGAIRSMCGVLEQPALNHRIDVIDGVLEADARHLMQEFFRRRRRRPRAVAPGEIG